MKDNKQSYQIEFGDGTKEKVELNDVEAKIKLKELLKKAKEKNTSLSFELVK